MTPFDLERGRVLLAYALLIAEEIALLALPALIGITVDRLLAGDQSGLLLLAGGIGAILLFGAVRRFYDTRVFAGAERRLAEDATLRAAARGVRLARLRQVHELVQTYERSVPEGLAAIVAGLGSLVVSAWYDWRVGGAALIAALTLLGLDRIYARKVERLNRLLNDRTEQDLTVLDQADAVVIGAHLDQWRVLRIARSDAEIVIYLLNWLVLLALVLGALALIARREATPGAVFAQMSYVLAFAESWNRWPVISERLAQARDIARRLAAQPIA
ncbi:ABC transporter six-transmembrane domain-containing protein [Nostoc sp. CHAB 5844]|nr:ABC transporter six-transmembrane domain-containing protein [Nostoc sp. CHAB 5844]